MPPRYDIAEDGTTDRGDSSVDLFRVVVVLFLSVLTVMVLGLDALLYTAKMYIRLQPPSFCSYCYHLAFVFVLLFKLYT